MEDLVHRLLGHPLTRGLDLDSPDTTELRREIILSKPFLRQVYEDWYHAIVHRIPEGPGAVLEVGAGGGFFEAILPHLVTSEVFSVPHVDIVADARRLPIRDGALKAVVMTNVFHHVPDVALFLSEAERALLPGGRIVMVEPWNTSWSRFVHKRFHDEIMAPDTASWAFPSTGPLSSANAALAWMVVARDRVRLESDWDFVVMEAQPFMPFRYLASGGVSLRSLQPGWAYPIWRWIDNIPTMKRRLGVFALIVIEKIA